MKKFDNLFKDLIEENTNPNASVLNDLIKQLADVSDFDEAKQLSFDYIKKTNIKPRDKQSMLVTIAHKIRSYDKLIQYIWNAKLKFEGLGVI